MAVTNNANIPNIDNPLTLVYCEGFVGSYIFCDLDATIKIVWFETEVRAFDGELTLTSMESEAYQGPVLVGDLLYVPSISADTELLTRPIILGDISVYPVKMEGLATRSISLVGDATLDRLIELSGNIIQETTSYFDGAIYLINDASRFQIIGEGDTAATVYNNHTIVLNLRTKAHCIFDEATLNAYATTGELLFGSYKNKNISDAFIFGRSADELTVTVKNDEITSRAYTVSYEASEQANLKNKKLKLSKGLTGTNWQIQLANVNGEYAEVRGIDLFVNELKRHV